MKTKQWKVMLGNDADNCKHTKFICADCNTYIFQQPVWSKTRELQMMRAMRRLREATEESGVSIDQQQESKDGTESVEE